MCMGLSFICPLTHHLFIPAPVWIIMTCWTPASTKVRTQYEGVGGGAKLRRGVRGRERCTHGQANFFFLRALELGWQPSCGYQGQWAEGLLCGAFATILPVLFNHSELLLEWQLEKFPLMWDWGPSCHAGAAGMGLLEWNESVQSCLSDLARSRGFLTYGGRTMIDFLLFSPPAFACYCFQWSGE